MPLIKNSKTMRKYIEHGLLMNGYTIPSKYLGGK